MCSITLLICTELRAHIIVVGALYKINLIYYNYQYGYRHKCMVCLFIANKVGFLFVCFFNVNFCWYNFLVHVASMIIVRPI